MVGRKERQVSLYYLNNIMNKPMPINLERKIFDALDDYSRDFFGMDLDTWRVSPRDKPAAGIPRDRRALCEVIRRRKIVDIAATGYDNSLDRIFNMFKIEAEDQAVLRYMMFVARISFLQELDACIRNEFRKSKAYRLLAKMIGITPAAIKKSFSI